MLQLQHAPTSSGSHLSRPACPVAVSGWEHLVAYVAILTMTSLSAAVSSNVPLNPPDRLFS